MVRLTSGFILLVGGGVGCFCLALIIGLHAVVPLVNPSPPTYLEPHGCELPCWQGLQPGEVHEDDGLFLQKIQSLNRYSGRLVRDENGRILLIELTLRGDITLGEVILALGVPSHVLARNVAGTTRFSTRRQVLVGASLYFGKGLIEVQAVREDTYAWRLVPHMVVRRIRYFAPSPEGSVIPLGTPRWRGFSALPEAN